jgi:hypothetical protein
LRIVNSLLGRLKEEAQEEYSDEEDAYPED